MKKIINKKFLFILTALLMLFIVNNNSPKNIRAAVNFEEMTGYDIEAYQPAEFIGDADADNGFSFFWSESNQIYFDVDYIYKIEFGGTEIVHLYDDRAMSAYTFTSGDIFTISIKEHGGFGLAFFINETVILPHEGPFVFTHSDIKFYRSIVDNSRPVVSGEEIFVVNVDLEKPVEWFLTFFTAIDDVDGDISDQLVIINDNYTPNKRILDVPHKVTIRATDSSNNFTEVDFFVTVVDRTKPIINGPSGLIEISYTEVFDFEEFISNLTVTDNHSILTSEDIFISENNYVGNEETLGTYLIIYAVSDDSNNVGHYTKNIKVIDDKNPIIQGPDLITSHVNTTLVVSDVTALLTAYDDYDGNLTSKLKLIEDNFTGNGNKKGSYILVYEVKDNAGNSSTKNITIQRIDNVPPKIFIIDGSTIRTTPEIKLTLEQIIQVLTATGQMNIDTQTHVYVTQENYFGNEDKIGKYQIFLETKSTSGVEKEHEVNIQVLETEDEGTTINPSDDLTDWFKNNRYIVLGLLAAIIIVLILLVKPKKKSGKRRR